MISLVKYDKTLFKAETAYKHVWYSNITKGVGGCQDMMIAESLKSHLIISNTQKNGWRYAYTDTIEALLKKNYGIFEIIREYVKRKVHFDIEYYFDLDIKEEKDTPFNVLEIVKLKILEVFENAKMAISGSYDYDKEKNKMKASYHITVFNWYANDYEEAQYIKEFCKNANLEIYNDLNEKFELKDNNDKPFNDSNKNKFSFFDCSIYAKNKLMKCVNQSKRGSPRIQKIIENDDIKNHIITEGSEPFDLDNMTNILNSKIKIYIKEVNKEENKRRKLLNYESLPDRKDFNEEDLKKMVESYKWEDATPLETLKIIPNKLKGESGAYETEDVIKIMYWAIGNSLTFEEFWDWNSQRGNTLERLNHYREVWDSAEHNMTHATNGFIITLLEKFYKGITKPESSRKFKKSFILESENKKFISEVRDLQLSDFDDRTEKNIILATPMGTRKTGVVIDYIKKYNPEKILFLSPRRTFSTNLVNRYKKDDIEITDYKTIRPKTEEAMKDAKRLTMSAQSIRYVEKCSYDLIIFDESESVLNSFYGNCATHYRDKKSFVSENFKVLTEKIKYAKKIIWMDAFTSALTRDFINDEKNTFIVDMVKPTALRTVLWYDSRNYNICEKSWLSNIIDDIKDGKKLFIYVPKRDHQGIIDILIKKAGLNENQILDYFGGAVKNKKLEDVNTLWGDSNIKAVITNSAITVGVNFDTKDIFHKIYANYASFNGARDFCQTMMRIRDLITKEIHLIITPSKRNNDFEAPYDAPTCMTWKTMQENLKKEAITYKNVRESLGFFFKMAGFVEKKTDVMINDELATELDEIMKASYNMFSYDNIPKFKTYDEMKETELRTFADDCCDMEKLMVQKYYFLLQFEESAEKTHDHILRKIWDEKYAQTVKNVISFDAVSTHFMQDFYKANNIDIIDEIPILPKIGISTVEIKRNLNFDVFPKNNNSHTVSKIMNAFWGKQVYKLSIDEKTQKAKTVRHNNKKYKKYDTDADFLEIVNFVRKYKRKPLDLKNSDALNPFI